MIEIRHNKTPKELDDLEKRLQKNPNLAYCDICDKVVAYSIGECTRTIHTRPRPFAYKRKKAICPICNHEAYNPDIESENDQRKIKAFADYKNGLI